MTGTRPYRCDRCDWRGWSVDPGRTAGLRSDAPPPDPPNLQRTALARDEWSRALDLHALDPPLVPAEESDRH